METSHDEDEVLVPAEAELHEEPTAWPNDEGNADAELKTEDGKS